MVASSAVCAASMHADWRLGNHPKSGDYPPSGPGAMAAGADALFRRSGLADPQVTSAAYRLNTGVAEERAARGGATLVGRPGAMGRPTPSFAG